MTYFAFLLLVPTTLLRTPRLLSYLSAVGIAASITVVLSVLAAAFYFGSIAEEFSESSHLSNTTGSYHTLWDSSGIPIGYGLIAFTFSGHALVPSIYSSMERPQDFEKNDYFIIYDMCYMLHYYRCEWLLYFWFCC